MKRILAALLALVMALGLVACAEPAKTETITVLTESLRTIYGREVKTVYTYSDRGNLLTTTMYLGDHMYQKMSRRTVQGVTYVTVTDDDGNESTQSTYTTYDEKGNVKEVETLVGAMTVSLTKYTYDDDGNVLTTSTTTSAGTATYAYTYDDRGNTVRLETTVTGDDPSSQTIIYAYNEEDYVTREETYDGENVLVGVIVYTYDGNSRTMTNYDGNGEPTGEVVNAVYDEDGNMLRETTILDGEVAQTIVNTYETMEIPVEE